MKLMPYNKSFIVLLSMSSAPYAGEPPHAPIEQAYFKCISSKNLEGGIYGKGPFKKFGPEDPLCSTSQWIKINKTEFKVLAEQWYSYDWKNSLVWWQNND